MLAGTSESRRDAIVVLDARMPTVPRLGKVQEFCLAFDSPHFVERALSAKRRGSQAA